MAPDARKHRPHSRLGRARLRLRLGIALSALVSLSALLTLLGGTSAQADGISLSVSPARLDFEVTAGQSLTDAIEVTNHTDKPARVRVHALDFVVGPSGDFVYPAAGSSTYSAAKWITVPEAEFTLKAQEKRKISYTIDVPKDAEPGGHYAMLFFETAAGEPGNVQVTGRVGCQVLLTVAGPIQRSLSIEALSVPRLAFGAGDEATILVRNIGNVHALPAGYVQVWGGLPGTERHWELPLVTLLPNSTHEYRVVMDPLPWLGRVRAKTEVKYGPKFGVFDQSVAATVDFYVVSWKVILIADLLLVGFDVVLFREWRRRRRAGGGGRRSRLIPR